MKLIAALSFLILILFSSCIAYQSGGLNSNSAGTNYQYEDIAFGEAQANRFFLFGGMRKDALLLQAKRDLITARPLLRNEEYINFTYDFKKSFIFGLSRTKVSVSADVILHTDEAPSERYSENYIAKVFVSSDKDTLFHVGDSVRIEFGVKGIILQNKSLKRCKVLYENEAGEYKSKSVDERVLYNLKGTWNRFNVGDKIIFREDWETHPIEGEIAGIGKLRILVLKANGELHQSTYKDISLQNE